MNISDELQNTVAELVVKGKGILAADESAPTIAKRLAAIQVESTEESRRFYRSFLLSTPKIGECISGVILFEETLTQKTDDGILIPDLVTNQKMVPGIKVDKGKLPLPNSPGDEITQGLGGLADRLEKYKQQGARFAKWRDVYHIANKDAPDNPGWLAITTNAEVLARYAAVCQQLGIVPIVEPEVLIDGDHSIDRCAEVTEIVLHEVFHALHRHGVILEHMLLKPNMVMPGKEHSVKASPEEIAEKTIRVMRRSVPAAMPGIHFLSGGQTPEEATANLNAMNAMAEQPWELSFSFGRALQQPVIQAWQGKPENIELAQEALAKRAMLNSLARYGRYQADMENE